ncbi:MAG: hypothetical protein EZS28_040449 [Streblomastix strix]|uniref:Uncharacterized protein n=1 Tax=Streblomastix strix TaxID=222440 RepID=A0A5J4U0R2_9EUKA|nr:MAG: hypothetical protein EZS28_040449 [Streblomastix strix]
MFNDIQSSGLFDKIEQMIKDKIEEEKEQKKYSNETEQLIRIYILIMKGRESKQEKIDICANVIEKNIINLLNIINKLKEEDNKEINNEQRNEEIERQIQQSAQLIRVIHLIREQDPNSEEDWETRIADQIMKIVKERICPLIHLNCPPQINCQQYINIPQSPAIIELKSDVFQNLFNVSKNNQEFNDILLNDHNIIPHLIHPLIQFASESQLKKKTNSQEQHDQQQTESFSSLSLITSSIDLLSNTNNYIINNNKCKVVINAPNVLRSFISLSGYKINIHFSQENDQQTFAVRHSSRGCLWNIHYSGDASAHSELVNTRYVRVLIIAISTASGAGEEQDDEIYWGLFRISNFLSNLHQGRNNDEPPFQYFPPQPLLVHRSVEQIEEEGGNEEIESQLINEGNGWNIKDEVNETKGWILNYFTEQGNQRPDWYNY